MTLHEDLPMKKLFLKWVMILFGAYLFLCMVWLIITTHNKNVYRESKKAIKQKNAQEYEFKTTAVH